MSLERLLAWMAEQGVDAAYLTSPISIAYLTGFRAEPHERLMALTIRGGRVDLVVPGLELEAARQAATGVEVRAWQDGEDPYRLVGEGLGASPPRLAVEKGNLTLSAYEQVAARIAPEVVVDAGPALRALRLRKTEAEIETLAEAARITDAVTSIVTERLRVGQTELDVSLVITQAIAEAGAGHSFPSLVQFGDHSAMPHSRPSTRRLAPVSFALLDFGASWKGYCADTTRTLAFDPDAKQREVHQVVLDAHDAAVATVRAGVTAGAVDEAARAVIRDAGYGEHFIHRVGHGLGLDGHEDPSLDPGSDVVLEPGMAITIEPGIYIPGWGGVRIEDDVIVEEDGARVLTTAPRDLALG